MIRTWKLTNTSTEELNFNDPSSLDVVTRQLPEGYYSTFRTYNGGTRVLRLAAHLRRLYEPVSTPEIDPFSLRRQLNSLLELFRPDEARVRMIMTKEGQCYISIEPLKELPHDVYENGVHVETVELQRQHPRLKSTSFITRSDQERKHIAQQGIFEALLAKDGKILEGMTSNFFYVKNPHAHQNEEQPKREGILYTTQHDILLGVTRETVIRIARGRGVEVKYRPLQLDRLAAVGESFITSSSRGIVPVVKIDDVSIGQGRPGSLTKDLMAAYKSYVIENAESILPHQ